MFQCTADDLLAFFKFYGWEAKFGDDGRCRTGWQGRNKNYAMEVVVNATLVAFNVSPLIVLGADLRRSTEILSLLLELNSDAQLVKLSIGEEGAVTLSATALVDGFRYQNFARLIEILGYYCDLFYEIISVTLSNFGGGDPPSEIHVTH